MPTHMRSRFRPAELTEWEPAEPMPFTKGIRTMRMPAATGWMNPWRHGTLLFDLATDPEQLHPLIDDDLELRMIDLLVRLLHESDAPLSQFERLGLPTEGPARREHLLVREQRDRATALAVPLPDETALGASELLSLPIAQIAQDPRTRTLIEERTGLGRTELVAAPGAMTLLDLARYAFISADDLHSLAAELSPATTNAPL